MNPDSNISAALEYYGPPSVLSSSSKVPPSTDTMIQDDRVTHVPPGPLDCLKWTWLTRLSGSLFSSGFEKEMGIPLVMCVNGDGGKSLCIAIGTSKALVLLYDLKQNLLGVLGNISLGIFLS